MREVFFVFELLRFDTNSTMFTLLNVKKLGWAVMVDVFTINNRSLVGLLWDYQNNEIGLDLFWVRIRRLGRLIYDG